MFIVGGLLLGGAIVLMWFFMRKQAQASLQWPATPGTIVDSRLITKMDSEGDESIEASITYAYTVGGSALQGSRIKIGASSARSMVQQYPTGADVQVYYDPAKPSSAVLEPGGSGLTLLLVIGIIVMIGGVVIGVMKGTS
jgi:hypothetical protein